MKLSTGKTGNTITGSIFDVALSPLLRQLRDYDPQLYVKWNAKKRGGIGCWEVRRKPDYKTVKETFRFQGNTFHVFEYNENNFENHVMDVSNLDYRILPKIKRMDVWAKSYRGKNFVDDIEAAEKEFEEKEALKADDVRQYMIRDNRRQMNEFKEYVLSGGDPNRLADYWGK